MAKDRRKLQHIHSSVPDKQPTPSSLEVGEIAVNNAKDQEFLSLKNSDDKVVRFSSDEQIVTIMEKKEVMPYSGVVDNVHLDTNRSNIEIKFNQVVAGNTVKHDVVNGAKDIDGQPVNPTSDSGLTNGAGFAIDMSQYAMIGANPSFSSTTNTCRTTLSGTTIIRGLDGDCGSLLDIKVDSAKTDVETANTEITSANTTIGTNTTTISGNTTLTVSGTTNETHNGDVSITNANDVYENTSGNTIVAIKGSLSEDITVNKNLIVSGINTTVIGGNDNLTVSGSTTENKYGNIIENNYTNKTENTSGNVVTNTSGMTTEVKIGNVVENHSGTTTENKKGAVIENNLSTKTENTTGVLTENNSSDYVLNTSGTTTEIKIGNVVENHSGATTENKKGNVTENNLSNKIENTTGNTEINTSGTTTENKKGNVTENNLSRKTENTNGVLTENNSSDYYLNRSGATTEVKIGDVSENHSGTTTENKKGNVTENNLSTKTENTIGVLTENNSSDYYLNRTGNTTEVKIGDVTETHSGTTTENYRGKWTVNAQSGTEITSCDEFTVNTNNFKVKQCLDNSGSAEFDFCDGYKINTDSMVISACTTGGTMVVKEGAINISGDTLTIRESGATNFSGASLTETTAGNTIINASGSTTINSDNGTNINTNGGNTNISTTGNTCIVSTGTSAIVGAVKTNIGKDCSDDNQTTTLNINGTTINEAGTTINVDAVDYNVDAADVCISASTKACFYGKDTKVGVECDGNVATTTTIEGSTINISGTTINVDAADYDLDATNVCVSASTKASFYGATTNIGIDCNNSTTASTINVSGATINEGGTNISVNASSSYTVNSNDVCITSTGEADFGGDTNTRIGTNCSGSGISNNTTIYASSSVTINSPKTYITGDTYLSGNTYFKPDCETEISSTTINSAVCEVLERSKVSITTTTDPEAGVLKRYSFSQNGTPIGTVDVPKDYLVKSGTVIVSGGTKYIDLVLNTRPTVTGTPDEHIYIDVADLVTDTVHTSTGGTLTITSGHTTETGNDWWNYEIAHNLKWGLGTPSADATGYNGSVEKTITIPSDASHIAMRNVSWTYGDVKTASGSSYIPSQTENGSFVIPKCVSDINRAKLKFSFGSSTGQSSDVTYDPGSACDNEVANTINIPTCVSHLNRAKFGYSYGSVSAKTSSDDGVYDPGENCTNTNSDSIVIPTCVAEMKNYNGNCYNFDDDLCITGDVTATGSFYSTSDRRKKDNIEYIDNNSKLRVRNIPLMSFSYKTDNTHRKLYGIIAQDAEAVGLNELVHIDNDGYKSVDYTSFLILRIAYLEKMLGVLNDRIEKLEQQNS